MDQKERDLREMEPVSEEPETAEVNEQEESIVSTVYDWARSLVAAVVGVVLLFTFVARLIGVSGGSMENTLYSGDRVLVLNPIFCDFQAGDIVVADSYNAILDETIIKRIVAVGGQTVDIDFYRGIVYVDGVALEEPYIKEPTFTSEGLSFPITLAEDEVFLLGDNRNASTDSRSYMLGPGKVGYLQGEAVFLLFPGPTKGTDKRDFGRIGFLK